MSAGSMGSLGLELFVDAAKFGGDLAKLPAMLRKVGDRMGGIATGFGVGIGVAIGSAVTSAFGTFAKESLAVGADFEKEMSKVRAVTDGTSGEMRKLATAARDMARGGTFSASQVAQGMEQLGSAGLSVEKILRTTPAVLDLAAAGDISLADSAKIAAAAIVNFGLSADDARRVVDVLATGAAVSATTVHEIGEAFKFAAPIGKTFGKSVEQVVAPLEVLANAGVRAEMAGTGLRQVFSKLSGENKSVNTLLTELGVNIDAMKVLPLADQLDVLNAKMAGMSEVERAGKLLKAFGERGGPTMAAMLAQGGDSLRRMEAGLTRAGGAAAKMAGTKLDNVAGAWQRVGRAFDEVRLRVFDALAPYLRQWASKVEGWFNRLAEAVPAAMAKVVAFAKQVWPLIEGYGRAGAAMLATVGSAAANLFGKVDWAYWRDQAVKALAVAEFAWANFGKVGSLVLGEMQAKAAQLYLKLGYFKDFLLAGFRWIGSNITAIFSDMVTNAVTAFGEIQRNAKGMWDFIRTGGSNFTIGVSPPKWTSSTSAFVPPPDPSGAVYAGLRSMLGLDKGWAALSADLSKLIDARLNTARGGGGAINPFSGAAWSRIFKPLGDSFMEQIRPGLKAIGVEFDAIRAKQAGAAGVGKAMGGGYLSKLWDGLANVGKMLADAAGSAPAPEPMRASFTGLQDAWRGIQKAAYETPESKATKDAAAATKKNTTAASKNTAAIQDLAKAYRQGNRGIFVGP